MHIIKGLVRGKGCLSVGTSAGWSPQVRECLRVSQESNQKWRDSMWEHLCVIEGWYTEDSPQEVMPVHGNVCRCAGSGALAGIGSPLTPSPFRSPSWTRRPEVRSASPSTSRHPTYPLVIFTYIKLVILLTPFLVIILLFIAPFPISPYIDLNTTLPSRDATSFPFRISF